ncbi:cytochrome d ubiquinol oxidase subunit II [Plantactinospora sp. S1510]|uniref:Cytochrome d ubiquinol oxidase subunit II n=1 Tax=Plantactinospora alkalitolerans TaxID=2789879 RepID=A0ABS0GPC3_9ACTN|nr:cytochrome d ubiquinol oxidase subunit II [Plantactinospora alkalitolerans]MBF9128042.1 cytochrome d ubiquinol oxidase subunit II [Plantactinospora alkalitolerans]
MHTAWYVLLGLFFATYLVLGGYDYGVGMLLARPDRKRSDGAREPSDGGRERSDAELSDRRRADLTALGPYFLGNEVWLVAAVGILFGAFPMLEGELLSGLYPAVLLALGGVVVVIVAVPLRSRPSGPRWRRRWDRAVVAGSLLSAGGWGIVLAGLLQGVPVAADGHVDGPGRVFTPFTVAGGLLLVALVAVHGAAFLALRLPGDSGRQLAGIGRRLVLPALAAIAATTALGLLSERVRDTVRQPVAGVLLPVVLGLALLLARRAFDRQRPGLAFVATSLALAAPVLLIGATTWPYALVSSVDPAASLTVGAAAASEPTLRLLSWLIVPLLPALLGFQLVSWWIFRGRLDARTPVYW